MSYELFKKLSSDDKLYNLVKDSVEYSNWEGAERRKKDRWGWSPSMLKEYICTRMAVFDIIVDNREIPYLKPDFESLLKMNLGTQGHKVIEEGLRHAGRFSKTYEIDILGIEKYLPENRYAVTGRCDFIYRQNIKRTSESEDGQGEVWIPGESIVCDIKFGFKPVTEVPSYYMPQIQMYMHGFNYTRGAFLYIWLNQGQWQHRLFTKGFGYNPDFVEMYLRNFMKAAKFLKEKKIPEATCPVLKNKLKPQQMSMFCPYWAICKKQFEPKLYWERNEFVVKSYKWSF